MPTTLPGGSRLVLIDATSNAGGPAACWAKSVAQKETKNSANPHGSHVTSMTLSADEALSVE
jgi:hypothetical protein